MNSNKKLIVFMHFHNSCARNDGHFTLLIKTGIAHKERTLSQAIRNSFKKCEGSFETVKTDNGGQMIVVFTIKEINYSVASLFCDLVQPRLHVYLWY